MTSYIGCISFCVDVEHRFVINIAQSTPLHQYAFKDNEPSYKVRLQINQHLKSSNGYCSICVSNQILDIADIFPNCTKYLISSRTSEYFRTKWRYLRVFTPWPNLPLWELSSCLHLLVCPFIHHPRPWTKDYPTATFYM